MREITGGDKRPRLFTANRSAVQFQSVIVT